MEVSSSKRRLNNPNFNIFENVETQYTKRPRRQISTNLYQDVEPISFLSNLSALSSAFAEDYNPIAPEIQNSTPNRSIASQTQCTASTTITRISHSVRSRKQVCVGSPPHSDFSIRQVAPPDPRIRYLC